MRKLYLVLLSFAMSSLAMKAQEAKMANLGDFKLTNGDVIRDCEMGYRTFGTLSATRNNVVVIPTWASGQTAMLIPLIGPGKFIDSSKYFVVAIDAFANGVSSSPSNSKEQPRMAFPQFTIHDVVVAEHMLLTQQLHLSHVLAVIGVSMGGMQTFDWMVSYPGYMTKAIPIEGSPRLASYDLIMWQTQIDVIKMDPTWINGNYTKNPAVLTETRLRFLTQSTPEKVDSQIRDGAIPQTSLDTVEAVDANDHIRQAEAMMSMDVSKLAGGSMADAARKVRARVLVIVSIRDHTVTPFPALSFAKMIDAKTIVLNSVCGHQAAACDAPTIYEAVGKFLAQ